jgi:hypothetical protein
MPMMTNKGVYMNILTRKIRRKNYTLLEFCDYALISLRTYRRWEKEGHAMNVWLVNKVNELEIK